MELTDFYSAKEYNEPGTTKIINGINFVDLREFDEFALMFHVSTYGENRFKKKFDFTNFEQIKSILFNDYKYGGIIPKNGKLILSDIPIDNSPVKKEPRKEINLPPILPKPLPLPKKIIEQKIEDVGEKIGYAKKDMIRRYANRINLKEETLSKIFPPPNYEKLLELGVSIPDLSTIKCAYEEAKYASKKRIINKVSAIRFYANYAKAVLNGNESLDFTDGTSQFTDFGKEFISLRSKAINNLIEKAGTAYFKINLSSIKINALRDFVNSYLQKTENIENIKFTTTNGYSKRNYFETEKEAIDSFINLSLNSTIVNDLKENKYKVTAYHDRQKKTIFLGFPLRGKGVITIIEGFTTASDAWKYLSENQTELQEKCEKLSLENKEEKKESIRLKFRNEMARERVGANKREGKDISAKECMHTFNFRAIEFGNWVAQKERQIFINKSYDSFMDLSDVIGVSPKALSLNGTLAIAFGSRGEGKNSAHYEPDRKVINLTKMKGAGSLAHEWFHAFDNYFAKNIDGFATEQNTKDDAREQVKKSFIEVIDSIRCTFYQTRSKRLDAIQNKRYYGTDIELAARAFEIYVHDKLNKKGYLNDFLVNFVNQETWNGKSETYPYPVGDDAEKINETFDKLFNIIEEKDQVLFRSIPEKQSEQENIYHSSSESKEQAIDDISKKLGVIVEKVESREYLPTHLRKRMKNGNRYPGIYDTTTDKVYVILNEILNEADAKATILHETLGHKGLRALKGKGFEKFLDDVCESMSFSKREEYLKRFNNNKLLATEEYLAEFAEGYKNPSTWEKVKAIFNNFLRKIGINIKMSDGDLMYTFKRAKNKLTPSYPKEKTSKIVKITPAKTTTSKNVFLAKFGVTFKPEIYTKMVQPLVKANAGVWNKKYKSAIFSKLTSAESFKNSLSEKILNKEIPVLSWKKEKSPLSPITKSRRI